MSVAYLRRMVRLRLTVHPASVLEKEKGPWTKRNLPC